MVKNPQISPDNLGITHERETLKVTVELSPHASKLFRARKGRFGGFPPSDARLAKGMLETTLREYWIAQPDRADHLDALTNEVLQHTKAVNPKASKNHALKRPRQTGRKGLERKGRKE